MAEASPAPQDAALRFRRILLATIFSAPILLGPIWVLPLVVVDPMTWITLTMVTCLFGWPVGAVTGFLFCRPLRAVWLRTFDAGQARGWNLYPVTILASVLTAVLASGVGVLVMLAGTLALRGGRIEVPPLWDVVRFLLMIVPYVALAAVLASAVLGRPTRKARA